MAIVSFDNNNNLYKSGKATVWKAELENSMITIWFKLENGKTVRENYRLSKTNETDKLRAAVAVLLGSTPEEFDTSILIGLPCYVRLEARPWKEGKTWTGVAEVLPYRDEAETASFDNDSIKNELYNSSENKMNDKDKSICQPLRDSIIPF